MDGRDRVDSIALTEETVQRSTNKLKLTQIWN